jgi:uncharacterized protein involved in exopolysaccharide biosynthesis
VSDHDHDIEYARKHHLHYDLAGDAERAHSRITHLQEELGELRAELADALGRIRQLEEQTPEAREAEYEADVALADLAESGYDAEERES